MLFVHRRASVAAALGTDKIPEKSGLIWFDVFEYLPTYFGTQLGGTALIILFVVAFSMYMAEIGASQRLGEALAKPILKIKSKVLLLACSTVIAFVLMLILPSAMGTFVVCLGVLFPTLVAAGINPISIMLAFFVGCNVVMGPGNPFAVLVLGMMDGAPDAATFFIQYALPVGAITMVCAGIVGALWNLHLDKKVSEFPVVSEEALPQSAECAAPQVVRPLPRSAHRASHRVLEAHGPGDRVQRGWRILLLPDRGLHSPFPGFQEQA